jgi:NTE family protein
VKWLRPRRHASELSVVRLPLTRRRLLLAGALGAAGAVGASTGCTLNPDRNHNGPNAPRAAPLARPPRTAWVFSSGGPRGFVHVGVLKALDELGLVPDLVVGASAGSLVGSLYAAGLNARDIETLALDLQPLALARLAWGEDMLSGSAIADLVRSAAPQTQLERMPHAMACVAARQGDGVTVAFTAGDVGLAVQASSAIEGQFAPVRIHGERYVDPDWSTPMPVRVARALGATRVLAVDATAHLDRRPPGAERYLDSDRRKKALIEADARFADLVLKPDFGYWVSLSRDFRERAIEAGYRQTLAQGTALEALHSA